MSDREKEKNATNVLLEVDGRDSGQGRPLPDHRHATFFSQRPLSMPRLLQTQAWCVITHPTSSLSAPPLYVSSRAARQISLHQDLLCVCVCAAESEREGSMCVISDWTFFCSAGLFQLLLWRILLLLLLRSEEAGYLPDSDCAEVITVLCWKEGEREAEGGWGEAV